MSEKRFTGVYGKNHKILEKGRRDYDLLFAEDVQDIVDLLNSLAEENKRLKNEQDCLGSSLQFFAKQCKKLQEENERLKKNLECCEYHKFKKKLDVIHKQVDGKDYSVFSTLKSVYQGDTDEG